MRVQYALSMLEQRSTLSCQRSDHAVLHYMRRLIQNQYNNVIASGGGTAELVRVMKKEMSRLQ